MPEFRNLQLKSIFFRKYWPKSRFSKFWTKMEIFSKMLIEMKIFQILNPNRAFFENVDGNLNRNRSRDFQNFEPKSKLFSHMLTEIEIFEILNRNRNIFKKCWPKWSLPKFWTEIGICLENIDRNQDFRNFLPKLNFFPKCSLKSRFSKF